MALRPQPPRLPSPPYVEVGLIVARNPHVMMLRRAVSSLRAAGARPLSVCRLRKTMTLLSLAAGPVLLTYRSDRETEQYVGIEISISGDLLGNPSWIPLDANETAERERIRAFVQSVLLSACDHLHPLYGGVGVEWSISLPTELGSPGTWLPGDVFWSNELDKVDMSLARDLATIYGRPGRAFSHGTLIEVGRLLDAQAQSPTQPLAAGLVAATRLARSIANLDFGHLRGVTDSIS